MRFVSFGVGFCVHLVMFFLVVVIYSSRSYRKHIAHESKEYGYRFYTSNAATSAELCYTIAKSFTGGKQHERNQNGSGI